LGLRLWAPAHQALWTSAVLALSCGAGPTRSNATTATTGATTGASTGATTGTTTGTPSGEALDASHIVDATPSSKPPALTPGLWTNISPSGVNLAPGCCSKYPNVGFNNNTFGIDVIELDPSNPYTMYISVDVQGMWKSTNGGGSWTRLGTPPPAPTYASKVNYLDSPLAIRIDPNNSNHIYATEGVRGFTLGFWVSEDGGNTWTQPPGFITAQKTATNDVTTLVVDPTDFNHALIGSHSPWGNGKAGIMETTDGGNTFVLHQPAWSSTGTIGINFLFDPQLGIGNSQTWVVFTDGAGVWVTTNSGKDWKMLSASGSIHGGNNDLYYTKAGIIYAGANHNMMRSTDQGNTWVTIGPTTQDGYYMIMGDGNLLYAAPSNTGMATTAPVKFITSPETDGLTWTPYQGGAQTFGDGPSNMRFDAVNRIIYASCMDSGLLALKVLP
jgi:hypothetical protein